MIKFLKITFWIVLSLIILVIPLMVLEVGLRFINPQNFQNNASPGKLNQEETNTIRDLFSAMEKSRHKKWTHSLTGLGLTSKDGDWSKSYPATFADLRDRILNHKDSDKLTHPSVVRTKADGRLVYDVSYTTDKLFRRLVPQTSNKKTNTIILSGCSYTFGIGLNDNDTIQYALGQLRPFTKIHNLAISGSSINEQLRLMDLFPERSALPPLEKSIAVFIFTPHQINRVLCGRECMSKENVWMIGLPRYQLKNGLPVFKGNFSENFPWSASWMRDLSNFEVLDLLPGMIEVGDTYSYKLFTALLREYEARLKIQAGISELIVVNAYPSPKIEFHQLQRNLSKFGIKSVDLSYAHANQDMSDSWYIPLDKHFSPPGAYAIAWLIDHNLKKMGL